MKSFLYSTGAACAARPWRVIASWLIALGCGLALSTFFGGTPADDYDVPGTPSQAAIETLRAEFPDASGTDARVVLHQPAGAGVDPAIVEAVNQNLAKLDGVGFVLPPRWSDDGHVVLLSVQYSIPVTDFSGTEGVDALREAALPASDAGVQVEYGGFVAENGREIEGRAELIGLLVAAVVLFLAFGSIVAAGVPLLSAVVGLGLGFAGIFLAARFTTISGSAPMVAAMVGLGVGIDYALLLVTRFAEELRSTSHRSHAVGMATATAGTSVVFAGSTVLVSLLGLGLGGLPIYTSFGLATALVVAAVVAASLTLVPAICGLAGERLLSRRLRRGSENTLAKDSFESTLSFRWAATVARRPIAWALAALTLLLLIAAPALALRTWPQDAGSQSESNTTRKAYDLIAQAFGPGANGPLTIVTDLRVASADEVADLSALLQMTAGVETVSPVQQSESGNVGTFVLEPTVGPQDPAAAVLVKTLRSDVLPEWAQITGTTAVFSDISDRLAQRLWVVVLFVVALSLVLLTFMFRSVVVALKAAVMNLLSVGAAFGVLTAVFQWGWGAELLGLPHAVPVSSWVPILLFAVLFGLSMDYEVFLLSRVRDEWLSTGDPQGSVTRGVGATGRVISSAALIMVAVFVGFAGESDVTVKMIGIGMATAIAIDATLIRLVLLPATMQLLGSANWWLPSWLDRRLPAVRLEEFTPSAHRSTLSSKP